MVALCSTKGAETNWEQMFKKPLLPLIKLQKVNEQLVFNLYNYRGAPMVTTFICSVSSHIHRVWWLLDRAGKADLDVRLVELKKMLNFCSGWVLIYVHLCFYRAIKLRFPLDVGGLSRDGRVTTEISTGSLRHPHPQVFPNHYQY